jgi:hypothetical protein
MADPITAGAFLPGTWVTSFPSFVHDLPNDPNNIPQLGAFEHPGSGSGFRQTDGYMLAATILCLRFDANGSLIGKVKINRGGRKIFPQDAITGAYTGAWNNTLQVLEGEFTTIYPATDPADNIELTYYYIAKASDEIEWLWISATKGGAPHRHSVTRGTFKRVADPIMR